MMGDECTCAKVKLSDERVFTMLRDPNCLIHGDKAREMDDE